MVFFLFLKVVGKTIDDASWPKVSFLRAESTRVIRALQNETREDVILAELGALLENRQAHEFVTAEEIPSDAREKILRERVFLDYKLLEPGADIHYIKPFVYSFLLKEVCMGRERTHASWLAKVESVHIIHAS